jgi:hypothetical protein
MFSCRVCDLILDAADAELSQRLEAAADKQQQQQGPVPVPLWLNLMTMFGNETPMLVSQAAGQWIEQGPQCMCVYTRASLAQQERPLSSTFRSLMASWQFRGCVVLLRSTPLSLSLCL